MRRLHGGDRPAGTASAFRQSTSKATTAPPTAWHSWPPARVGITTCPLRTPNRTGWTTGRSPLVKSSRPRSGVASSRRHSTSVERHDRPGRGAVDDSRLSPGPVRRTLRDRGTPSVGTVRPASSTVLPHPRGIAGAIGLSVQPQIPSTTSRARGPADRTRARLFSGVRSRTDRPLGRCSGSAPRTTWRWQPPADGRG